jgi:signal transduction histidine kinase
MKKIGLVFLLFAVNTLLYAVNKPLILEDTSSQFAWREGNYSIYIDSLHCRPLPDIQKICTAGFFRKATHDSPRLKSSRNDMWAYFEVVNESNVSQTWLLELYDLHIDSYDIYVLKNDSLQNHFVGGDMFPFATKKINHKNFIHQIQFQKGIVYKVYIRIQSKQAVALNGVIRTYQNLLSYSNTEYMLLSIFYGIIGLMGIYSICIYIGTFEKMYLYFTMYILSIAWYSLSNDGLGYQYIWSNRIFNDYSQSAAVTSISIFSLLYSATFLQLKRISKKYCNAIKIIVAARFLVFVVGVIFYEPIIYLYQVDIGILILVFALGIYSYSNGFKAARFFILAYTALFIGFTTNLLMVLGLIGNNYITVYGLNFGAIAQLFLFSIAVADRLRIIMRETKNTQTGIIMQLKENHDLKDKLTRELEDKVKERTKELEFKNQQLDAFVYKASHDIKGPLKSIIGLAKLGLIDIKDEHAREYFLHIEKSSQRLDHLVEDLLEVAKIKNTITEEKVIDFEKIIEDVKESFINIPKFAEFYIDVSIKQDRDFYSDEKMIYSIFQNLVENAFNYRDTNKKKSILMIRIEVDKQKSVIEFADNGIGINKDLKDKVFDMFFRASDISGGTGLGLYLVKMAVNKIGGRIQVQTEVNKGTSFSIVI